MTTPASTPAAPADAPDDLRRFRRGSAIGGVLALGVLAWFATRGFATMFDAPRFGDFFDAQGHALLGGHWDVPAEVVSFERYDIGGRFYMYFGPTPALLRMPILLVTHALDGQLSRLSMIVACAVALVAIARLSWLARCSVRGNVAVTRREMVVAAGVVLVGGCGTILVFVAAWTAVYHEALAWGVAFALVSYGALVAWQLERHGRHLVLAAVAATLSLLARGSVGLGPVAALGLVLAVQLWHAVRARAASPRGAATGLDWRVVAGLGAACAVPLLLYGYVNAAKFGAPFDTPPMVKQDLLVNWPPRAAALAANAKLFGVEYAPTSLLHYLRPDGVVLDSLFPWLGPRMPTTVVGDAVFEQLHPVASTTATAPLAVLLAVGGSWLAVRRRHLRTVWLAPIAGAAVGSVGAVLVGFLDHRYQGDFVPLLVVAGVVGVWGLVDALAGWSRPLVTAVAVGAVALGAWSVWANVATAFVYQRTQHAWSTVDDRASLVKVQLGVADVLGTDVASRVAAGDALPDGGETGNLFVLGDCDGVYRFDGTSWLPVEQTPSTGYDRLRVSLDRDARGRQPVLSKVDDLGTTVLWVANAADGRVRFEYEWVPTGKAHGEPPIRFAPVERNADGSVDVSVRFDPRDDVNHFMQLRANGDLLYDGYVVATYGEGEIGEQHAAPGATSFSGSIRVLDVPTPLCDQLVDDGVRTPRS